MPAEKKDSPSTSQAMMKAINKYNKSHTVAYTFRLNKSTDAELIEYVDGLKNKSGTIKRLLTDDMKRNK
jgi:hypothetical protein